MASDSKRGEPGDRTELAQAIGRYALGEISLGKAAELAGVSRWEMQEVLEDAGIELRLAPRNEEELEEVVGVALDLE